MNWKAILAYAAVLFLFQSSAGFASGFFDIGRLVNARDPLSFLLCAALFAHLTLRVPRHRLAHACLVLAVYAAGANMVAPLLPSDLTDEPTLSVILEWLQLLAAAGCGLIIGWQLRRAPVDVRRS